MKNSKSNSGRMVRKDIKTIPIVIALFILLNSKIFSGFTIELQKKLKIPRGTTSLKKPLAFSVTENEFFLIPDYDAGDIKIYKKKKNSLSLIKILGKKGYGVGEFQQPKNCFYDRNFSQFAVIDYGLRKILIYKEKGGELEFERTHAINCFRLGYDIQLDKNMLFVSGNKVDPYKNHFDLYAIDITSDETSYLLPSYQKYGLKSFHDYEKKYLRKKDFPAIGVKGWFDIQGDYVYFVWEGDLKIFKINIKSGKINSFEGEKTSRYVKPYASKILLDGYEEAKKGNFDLILSERAKMSYVRNIFTRKGHIYVIYEGPGESNFRTQIYTLDGKFIKEVKIPGKPDSRMHLDKNRDVLYSLSSELDKDRGSEDYFILEYKIRK